MIIDDITTLELICYKRVTARRDHKCVCGKTIKKGEKYIRLFCTYNYGANCAVFKFHHGCGLCFLDEFNNKIDQLCCSDYPLDSLTINVNINPDIVENKPKLKLKRYRGSKLKLLKRGK